MKVFKLIILMLLIANGRTVIGQSIPFSGVLPYCKVDLTGSVVYKDSCYYLLPNMKVKDSFRIRIPKQLYFVDGMSEDLCNGKIYLHKRVFNTSVCISAGEGLKNQSNIIDQIRQYKNFTNKDSLNDSINLNNIFPLEKGQYFLIAVVKIKYLGQTYEIQSDPIAFDIEHNPPTSALYHE